MNNITTASRIFLGLAFLIFGLNGFFHFFQTPPVDAEAGKLLGAMFHSAYIFPMVAFFQVLSAILLLSKRFAALGAVILSPVMVNVVAVHLFLDPKGLVLAIVLFIAMLVVLIGNKEKFKSLFQA